MNYENEKEMNCMKRNQAFVRGSLIGGAIGDALGWPIEFLSYGDILKKFGRDGLQDLVCNKSGQAEVTDDTQMTLYTAEGILRSQTRFYEKGICHPPSVVYFAYLRWLTTQGYPRIEDKDWIYDGWLIKIRDLHERRAPGHTCLDSLSSGRRGTIEEPINNSKGCGGVMRVAPVGLFYPKRDAFQMAADFAALTHGHPSGYLSAGALAFMVADSLTGTELEVAVKNTLAELPKYKGYEECSQALLEALTLAQSDVNPQDAIGQLGEGWVGEEALAISVYCSITFKDDFKTALITAVNHDGDSDSTGAITGNILGAYKGIGSIPKEWLDQVELKNDIFQIADDLLVGHKEGEEWWTKYPGY